MKVSDEILQIFARRGAGAYFGECVSMTEHGLQAAHFARESGAAPALVIAALLHDIGHLIEDIPENLADWTVDARHEVGGSRWLAARFPPDISEPVRLHVPAKRYLCTVDDAYAAMLSPASLVTLKLQGGAMSPAEAARFETEPFHAQAVSVRRWDDQGKVADLVTPGVADYAELVEQMTTRRSA